MKFCFHHKCNRTLKSICTLNPFLRSSRQPMWRPWDHIQILHQRFGQGSSLEINLGCFVIVVGSWMSQKYPRKHSKALTPHSVIFYLGVPCHQIDYFGRKRWQHIFYNRLVFWHRDRSLDGNLHHSFAWKLTEDTGSCQGLLLVHGEVGLMVTLHIF